MKLDKSSVTANRAIYFKLIPAIWTFILFVPIARTISGWESYFEWYTATWTFQHWVYGAWLIIVGFGFTFETLTTWVHVRNSTSKFAAVVLGGLGLFAFILGAGFFGMFLDPFTGEGTLLAIILGLTIGMFISHAWTELFHRKRFIEALAGK